MVAGRIRGMGLRLGVVALALGCAEAARADILSVLDYSTPNGQSGFTTYHDDTYNGSGNPNVDGSALSGGTGQLTDGVLGTDNIFDNGTFDWIGWQSIQPTITFHLAQPSVLDTLSFRSANESSMFNDVAVFGGANVSFSNDGTTFFGNFTYNTPDSDRTGDQSRWVDIPLGQATASFVRVQLLDGVKVGEGLKPWIFISEAQVLGTAVPEPGAWGLLGSGLVAVAAWRRSRGRGPTPRGEIPSRHCCGKARSPSVDGEASIVRRG
jgi:hypothetical protein